MNFARDVVEARRPGRLALVELARDGARREWTLRRGRRARRAALAGAPARRRRRARRRRADAVGNRPEWVLAMVACFRQGARGAAVHRAAAREGPAAAPRGGAAARWSSPTSATRAVLAEAGWDGPTVWRPWGELRRRRRPRAAGRARAPRTRAWSRSLAAPRASRRRSLHAQRYLPGQRAAGRALARRAARRARLVHGGQRLVEVRPQRRSSRRGCAAPPRCCTTRASTPPSASSCSSASASTCSAWRRPSTA